MDRTAQLNAIQLFDAAAACGAEKRSLETSLLMIEGQIKAMADMDLSAPKDGPEPATRCPAIRKNPL
jgi:hypothetical protein